MSYFCIQSPLKLCYYFLYIFQSFFTSFTSFTFFPSTYSLYCTIQLILTTEWIFIEVSSYNLTLLVETTSSMIYRLIYQSTNFFASFSWTPNLSYLALLCLSFFILEFLFSPYLLAFSFLPILFSTLLLLPLKPFLSTSFSLFLFFWYSLLSSISYYSSP